MSRKPWFPFYAADWLSDARVTALTLPEQGAYVRLLAIQWREGSIPSDRSDLLRLVGLSIGEYSSAMSELFSIDKVLSFFGQFDANDPTRLRNDRLEEIRKETDRHQKDRVKAGKIGAKKRWLGHSLAIANPIAKHGQSQSQSQSQSHKDKEVIPSPPARFDFAAVYLAYPKKLGKKKGLERCKSQIKTEERYRDLIKAVANYSAYVAGKDPQFTKHFDSFLSVWEDWVNPPEIVPFRSKPPAWREPMQAAAENKREVL